ncbi:MAG: hypothetical protein K9J17_03270 [Flavobacteriales bacterium]|nr:hypothetical protein [Flavobacteriales bacterium]
MNLTLTKLSDQNLKWIILICSVLLYGLTLLNGYSIDDYLVSENLEIVDKGVEGIPEILTSYYSKTDNGTPFAYRPIGRISFALERSIWGERLWLSHLINVLLYALAVFLMFRFMITLMGEQYRVLLILTTAFFLCHPIHTEVVCSLKNREELLSFVFAVASSILLVKYVDQKRLRFLLGALALFLLSLPTKAGNVPLAGIMVLGFLLFRKWNWRQLFILGIPYFVIFAGYMLWVNHYFPNYIRTEYAFEESPLNFYPSMIERVPTGFVALFYFARFVLVPHPLAFFYGYAQIPVADWSTSQVYAGIVILISAVAAFFYHIKSKPIISFGIGIFLMSVAPFLNVVVPLPGIVAERWLLVASIGSSLILAYLMIILSTHVRFARLYIPVTALLLGLYTLRTVTRIPDWKSSRTLVYHDVEIVTRSFVPNFLAARFYYDDAVAAASPTERVQFMQLALRSNDVLREICKDNTRYVAKCAEINNELGNRQQTVQLAKELYLASNDRINYVQQALNLLLMNDDAEAGLELATDWASRNPTLSQPIIYQANFQLAARDTAAAISTFRRAVQFQDVDPRLNDYVESLARTFKNKP